MGVKQESNDTGLRLRTIPPRIPRQAFNEAEIAAGILAGSILIGCVLYTLSRLMP